MAPFCFLRRFVILVSTRFRDPAEFTSREWHGDDGILSWANSF
jgi:hypothetical protein